MNIGGRRQLDWILTTWHTEMTAVCETCQEMARHCMGAVEITHYQGIEVFLIRCVLSSTLAALCWKWQWDIECGFGDDTLESVIASYIWPCASSSCSSYSIDIWMIIWPHPSCRFCYKASAPSVVIWRGANCWKKQEFHSLLPQNRWGNIDPTQIIWGLKKCKLQIPELWEQNSADNG